MLINLYIVHSLSLKLILALFHFTFYGGSRETRLGFLEINFKLYTLDISINSNFFRCESVSANINV